MKTTMRPFNWLVCGLLLGATMYNCKTKDVSSITPFTYTFSVFDTVKMPELTQTAPATVTVTVGMVTSSTLAAAVSSALAGITASGQVPAAVQQAGADIGQAVPTEKVAALTGSFTPDMVSSGTLSSDMKKEVSAIAGSPALKAYMPTYTLPTVNGKPVGARLPASGLKPVAIANSILQDGGTDACRQAANAAYNTVAQSLESVRNAQTATVNATYTQLEAAANGEVASCQAGVPARYDGLRTTLRTQLTSSLSTLNSIRATLGDALYNQLALLAYVSYFQALDNVTLVQTADLTACSTTKDAKIAAAQTARDADVNRINASYNTVLSTATTARDRATASCHNQGNGG